MSRVQLALRVPDLAASIRLTAAGLASRLPLAWAVHGPSAVFFRFRGHSRRFPSRSAEGLIT
ncbi:hypothetical protein [Streptomyces scopuliridis]|uniref:hypothetical protein n=1 Tax=Streptomyces scopuliridis TaxID=452529 RepID=UPI0036A98CE8